MPNRVSKKEDQEDQRNHGVHLVFFVQWVLPERAMETQTPWRGSFFLTMMYVYECVWE